MIDVKYYSFRERKKQFREKTNFKVFHLMIFVV